MGRTQPSTSRRPLTRHPNTLIHTIPARIPRSTHHRGKNPRLPNHITLLTNHSFLFVPISLGPQRNLQSRLPPNNNFQKTSLPPRQNHPRPLWRKHTLPRPPRRRPLQPHGLHPLALRNPRGFQVVLFRYGVEHE